MPIRFLAGLLLSASILILAWGKNRPDSGPVIGAYGEYTGSKACGACHLRQYQEWQRSLHGKMIQVAGPQSILGDFERKNTFTDRGSDFRMYSRDGQYFIEEKPAGKLPVTYKVDFTLGSKRIQHYISVLEDGRMRVVFPTWDVQKSRWFHSIEIVRTSHYAEVPIQIWNKHCFDCHVTAERQNYDAASDTYRTQFVEPGIGCEMCHGPGRRHIASAGGPRVKQTIANPGRQSAPQQATVCGQCHSPRVIVQLGYQPGRNRFDFHLPTQAHFYIDNWYDPPMWGDGRMRRFAGEWLGLLQSECYLKGGATCITCHNPHNNRISEDSRLRGSSNALCARCHAEIERDLTKMSHHRADSEGSRCVNCHMPYTTNMMTSVERDHSLTVPAPENTVRYGIPNACNACHNDRSAEWAVSTLDSWFPKRSGKMAQRADALVNAKKREARAISPLIGLLLNSSENQIIRASAAGFLGEYKSPEVAAALAKALQDPEVLIRAEAARSLGEAGNASAVLALVKALRDSARIVRVHAAFSLIKLGKIRLEGENQEPFERAKREYREFLVSFPDQLRNRIDLGTYEALHGNHLQALQHYKLAMRLNPSSLEAQYYVGVASASLERWDDALSAFQRVLRMDPAYRNTQHLADRVLQIKSRRNP